jgi:hypothetical protein
MINDPKKSADRTSLSATGAMALTEVESKPRDKFALANEDVKQLLLLPDTAKNGRIRISKQQWLKFMEAEFNQRDKDGKRRTRPERVAPNEALSSAAQFLKPR